MALEINAGFELRPGTGQQWAIFWTAGWADRDWMGSVMRDKDTDDWKLSYRFRYHKDDKVWDSKDEKRWTNVKIPADTPIKKVRLDAKTFIYSALAAGEPTSDYTVFEPPNGTADELMEYMQSGDNPALHSRSVNTMEQVLKQAGDKETE